MIFFFFYFTILQFLASPEEINTVLKQVREKTLDLIQNKSSGLEPNMVKEMECIFLSGGGRHVETPEEVEQCFSLAIDRLAKEKKKRMDASIRIHRSLLPAMKIFFEKKEP